MVLIFHFGQVLSEVDADWWTGKLESGVIGLFPSNHVEQCKSCEFSCHPMIHV